MNLLEIQHRMLAAVMQPLTPGEQMQLRYSGRQVDARGGCRVHQAK